MESDRDALLLAAGLGTRLRPITDRIPKALLPVCGRPILDIHLERLLAPRGPARRVVVNTHHLAEPVREHIERHPSRDRVRVSHEPEILGTGGAIPHAAEHLRSDPIIVLNADGLLDPPLEEMLDFHAARARGGCEATLLLARDPFAPNVHVDGDRVVRIAPRREEGALTFTGCQILSRRFVDRLPRGRFHDIRETYAETIAERRLAAFVWEAGAGRAFIDIGTPALYLRAHRIAAEGGAPWIDARRGEGRPAEGYGWIDSAARVHPGARIEESIVIGAVEIARPVRIRRSILAPGAAVDSDLDGMLVTGWEVRPIEESGS